MKKFYYLLVMLMLSAFTFAQMTITQEGNTVTFTFDDTVADDLFDANGDTPNIYGWVTEDDTSGGAFNNIFGDWPGTPMTSLGENMWQTIVDLANFYEAGITINQVNWILNSANNGQTGDMLGTDYGFSPLTIENLSVNDLQTSKNLAQIVDSSLYINQAGDYLVSVFNVNGKLINQFKINASAKTMHNLNINQKGVYFIKIQSGKSVQNLKVLK